MPFIHVSLADKATDKQITDIKSRLGQVIETIPTKSEEWLMIRIDEDCKMFFSGKGLKAGGYIEINLYQKAPMENKKELIKKVYEICKDVLSYDAHNVFITIREYDNWGVDGDYI